MKQLTEKDADLITQEILKAEHDRTFEQMPPNFENVTLEDGINAANQITKSFNKTVAELAHR